MQLHHNRQMQPSNFAAPFCLFGGSDFYHIQCLAPRSVTATTTSVLPNMYCLHLHPKVLQHWRGMCFPVTASARAANFSNLCILQPL
jgi:hypothetical protein